MANEGQRAFHKVSCLCGAALRVDPLSPERRLRCPACGNSLDFIVTLDGKSKRPRVSIVVRAEAMIPEGESLATLADHGDEPAPAPPPRAATSVPRARTGKTGMGVLGTCICGMSFPVDSEELTSIQTCPQCQTEYHCVVKIERGTHERTAILVPVKTAPVRRPSIAPTALPPAATRSGKRTQVTAGRGRTRMMTPKAPVQIPAGAQGVLCPCGATLVVRKKDVVRGMVCESCGRGHKLQEVPDPQTLVPVIRIRPEPKK
jgi:hypothetical protein